jgi:hypothetical protein
MRDHRFEIDALDIIDGLILTVHVRRSWRLWIGLRLLSLAARLMRCTIDVEPAEDDDER